MAKAKTTFFCQSCGHESAKWLGKCPSCSSWNTFSEQVIEKKTKSDWGSLNSSSERIVPKTLNEIDAASTARIVTSDTELNRVLGGGIVPGSLILIGGEPGIGKSTLMLQFSLALHNCKTLYVSGEESESQIKMRAKRLGIAPAKADAFYTLIATNIRTIFLAIRSLLPQLLIIDSIQTLHSDVLDTPAGSIGQVRQCAAELMKFAKETNVPVFLVGHITKDGLLAGPKALEHMVDTALYFEGDRHLAYRILRTTKNRFGATSEIGIYEMLGSGLREVSNPSEILISPRDEPISGATIGATLEGSRPLLIEVQSLVSVASYGTPQRTPTGFDQKRLNMLLAVLEKRGGFPMGSRDVFLNMAGGIKVEDPAIDLAVCVSIISSTEEILVSSSCCFAAEVGLGGELRAVSQINRRVLEAEKLGFKEIYISTHNQKSIHTKKSGITLKPFSKLTEVIRDLFG